MNLPCRWEDRPQSWVLLPWEYYYMHRGQLIPNRVEWRYERVPDPRPPASETERLARELVRSHYRIGDMDAVRCPA